MCGVILPPGDGVIVMLAPLGDFLTRKAIK